MQGVRKSKLTNRHGKRRLRAIIPVTYTNESAPELAAPPDH